MTPSTSRRILSLLLLVSLQLLGLNLTAQPESGTDGTAKTTAQAKYAKLPLAFEPNQGQTDPSVDFLVHHGQAVTSFSSIGTTTSIGDKQITMSLDGATAQHFTGTDELPSKTNYFIGNDQTQWHSDVPNFGKLLANNVYPGIDLAYYGTNSTLEHDFIVNPGSDYRQIAFSFTGQDGLSLNASGDLTLKAGESELTLNAPVTYQMDDHGKHTIPSHFVLSGDTITVAVADSYDHTKPLVIDPTLIYSTYLGGSGLEAGDSVAVDANSNVYVVGSTTSTNFPTASPFQGSNAGGSDVFVSKLNAAGSALVYSTYLGGSGNESGQRVVVDTTGSAYLVGTTSSSNFPTQSPYQASYGGGTLDVFLSKLNPAGSALVYSTYLGGSLADGDGLAPDIAIDGTGNAYVAGSTHSGNFPTVAAYQGSLSGATDAFLTKFNAAGTGVVFSTYLGGSNQEAGARIALDNSSNIYLAGNTASTNFPTVSPYQGSLSGATDAFLVKFTPGGSALTFATYLGGSDFESIGGIAVDQSGSAYLTGYTFSTDYPTASPYQGSFGGTGGVYGDAFVTKFNPAGSALAYSTYLGGSDDDAGFAIAVNGTGNTYITGLTGSNNFPVQDAYQATKAGGITDTFVTKLASSGSSLSYSTYLGGNSQDQAMGIALSLSGTAVTTGFTTSTTFPTTSPFQGSSAGGTDVFITQLTEHTVDVTGTVSGTAPALLTFSLGTTSCDFGTLSASETKSCTHAMEASTNAAGGYVISYIPTTTLTSGANAITGMGSQTASVLGAEQFGLNLRANTASGSHTAAAFGADPSGGSGAASSAYDTADQFKFLTAGETIAQSAAASSSTAYTVSYIANITSLTEPGLYSNLMTYTIVASY